MVVHTNALDSAGSRLLTAPLVPNRLHKSPPHGPKPVAGISAIQTFYWRRFTRNNGPWIKNSRSAGLRENEAVSIIMFCILLGSTANTTPFPPANCWRATLISEVQEVNTLFVMFSLRACRTELGVRRWAGRGVEWSRRWFGGSLGKNALGELKNGRGRGRRAFDPEVACGLARFRRPAPSAAGCAGA